MSVNENLRQSVFFSRWPSCHYWISWPTCVNKRLIFVNGFQLSGRSDTFLSFTFHFVHLINLTERVDRLCCQPCWWHATSPISFSRRLIVLRCTFSARNLFIAIRLYNCSSMVVDSLDQHTRHRSKRLHVIVGWCTWKLLVFSLPDKYRTTASSVSEIYLFSMTHWQLVFILSVQLINE